MRLISSDHANPQLGISNHMAEPSTGQKSTDRSVYTTGNDTIAPRQRDGRVYRGKQSLDYVLRSGLAGGLAGCAVG